MKFASAILLFLTCVSANAAPLDVAPLPKLVRTDPVPPKPPTPVPPKPPAPVPPKPPAPAVVEDPTLTGPKSAPWMIELKAKSVPAASALRWQVYVKNKDGDYVLAAGKIQTRTVLTEKAFFFAGDVGEYLVQCSFQKGLEFVELEWKGQLTGGGEPKPPVPPTPPVPPVPPVPPTPPTPTPDPLKSFRVIVIYESAMTLTADQRAVAYGKAVEDWLNANCTEGKNGWRRRDKDAPGESDPTMAALWAAVKPAITTTPCIAIERNGKVTIINLDATPARMIETLNAYKGGK